MSDFCYICGRPLEKETTRMFGIGKECYEKICKYEAISTIHKRMTDPKYVSVDFIHEDLYHECYHKLKNDKKLREEEYKNLIQDKDFLDRNAFFQQIKGLYFQRRYLTHRLNKMHKAVMAKQMTKEQYAYHSKQLFRLFEKVMEKRFQKINFESGRNYVIDLIKSVNKR
nr:hypothetical protein [uncultured Bdellovibrio sp.]